MTRGTDTLAVADSTGMRGPQVFLAGLAGLAVGVWLVLTDADAYGQVIGYFAAACAVYAMIFIQALHPPFTVEADAEGVTIRWGFYRLAAPVRVAWEQVSSVSESYIQGRRSREAALVIWAADLRPAIARTRSPWVRLLLRSRQITRRKQLVAIPARAMSCGVDEMQRQLETLRNTALLVTRTDKPPTSKKHRPRD